MFQPKTIRIFAIIAMVLSVLGLLLSLIFINKAVLFFIMGIISWGLLFWASLIAFKLSSYKLYENEFRKVGIVTYCVILAFVLFLFVGLLVGFILSVILLSSVWGMKRNYDEWINEEVILPDQPGQGSDHP
jgi:ABC-type Fe3+-siderophore transport system permease subunit